ncbi:MAG: exo-alpha-sialidase, partial [Acidobacteriota bacterium]
DDWFVNWADFPSMAALGDGTLAAHWLEKTGSSAYAYAVRVCLSRDGGDTWGSPLTLHDDMSPTEHGFVSLAPLDGEQFLAVWLDGREMAAGDGEQHATAGAMTLRARTIHANGTLGEEQLLDDRVCDCCQTSAVTTGDGQVVVAYRDRSGEEVRDIASLHGHPVRGWSRPHPVHEDGWTIEGCPVNGPRLATLGDQTAVAWFTAAGDPGQPRVLVAFADETSGSFETPIQIDLGRPLGRVDATFLADGRLLVAWLDRAQGITDVVVRTVTRKRDLGVPLVVGRTSQARSSGFPRLARSEDQVVIAWTETDGDGHVRTALVRAASPRH